MKRQINSEAELVNAICKGLEVYDKTEDQILTIDDFEFGSLEYFDEYEMRYSDPVEVVELWGEKLVHAWLYASIKTQSSTHKQTQIHQNGEIIWTETIKIK